MAAWVCESDKKQAWRNLEKIGKSNVLA